MQRTALKFPGPGQVCLATDSLPAPQPGELLLRTTRTLISTGTEGRIYARDFAAGTHFAHWVKYPFHPGYLHCGVVEAVGPGVTGWSPGDRAATRAPHASHVTVSADRAVPVPAAVADEEAVWLGLGRITQIGVRAAGHQLGDTVVIAGLGLLGQLVAQYVALAGARTILALDPAPARLAFLAGLPTVQPFAGSAADALAAVRSANDGFRADVAYDVTGHHAVLPTLLPLVRDAGTVVVLGDTGRPHLQTLTPDLVTRGLHLVGAHDSQAPVQSPTRGLWTGRRMEEFFLHLLTQGRMNVRPLITHRFAPAAAAEAYEMLRTSRASAMGCLFVWSD